MIATDVIARGMDFKGVNCVINYDFPDSAAAYVHRIGEPLNLFILLFPLGVWVCAHHSKSSPFLLTIQSISRISFELFSRTILFSGYNTMVKRLFCVDISRNSFLLDECIFFNG